MDNPSPATIDWLRDLFSQMTESRRQLRPILIDIADDIGKGIFIDADSEEVNRLLKKILEAQEELSAVDQLKRATITKKLEQIDKSLTILEQNCRRDSFNVTLAKIETLVVDSDDPAIIEDVKKVKMQAEHLRNKSERMDAANFAKDAERFVRLAEIIEHSADGFSSEEFLEVHKSFQDIPLIAMALTRQIIHFAPPEPAEPEPEPEPEIKELPIKATQPTKHRLKAVELKFQKIQPPPSLDLMMIREDNFSIDKAKAKKQLGVKSFGKKIREIFESVDPLPIFKLFIKVRLFPVEDSKSVLVSGKLTKKIATLIPSAFEKLFNWGIVDKISWRGRELYFLNNFGFDICARYFIHSPLPSYSNDDFKELVKALIFSLTHIVEPHLKGKFKVEFSYNPNTPAIRAELKDSPSASLVMMFSMVLIGDTWAHELALFKILIESAIDSGRDLRAVILCAFSREDLPWMKIFETTKFKKIKFLMFTWDGLWDMDGNEVSLESLSDIWKTGTVDKKAAPSEDTAIQLNFGSEQETIAAAEDIFTVEVDIPAPETETEITIESFPVEEIPEPAEENPEPFAVEEPAEEIAKPAEEIAKPAEVEKPAEEIVEVEEIADDDILSGITRLFAGGESGRAMLALHALRDSFGEDETKLWAEELTEKIGFILDDPLTIRSLHNFNFDTFSFWTSATEIPEANIGNSFDYLNLAAMIKNFFAPANPTSYEIQKNWKLLNEDKLNEALKTCPAAKTLINLFKNFTGQTHRAFADCIGESGDNDEDKLKAALVKIEGVDGSAESILRTDIDHPHSRDLVRQIFRPNGFVRQYLSVENYYVEEILEFCRRFEEKDVDLNHVVAENSLAIDEAFFSEEKIIDYLDDIWNNPQDPLVRREHKRFAGYMRRRVVNAMKQILVALLNYVRVKRNLENSGGGAVQNAPVEQALQIVEELKAQIPSAKPNLGQIIFAAFVDNLTRRLKGENISLSYKNCLLGTKYIELENELPVIESFGIPDFSLQSRTEDFEADLRENTFSENLKNAYETALRNYDCGILRYLARYFLPQLELAEDEVKRKIFGVEQQVDRQIERFYKDFLNDLELSRNYSRITDQERIDKYIDAVGAAREHFSETKNAGIFQRFVRACCDSIEKASTPQKDALNERFKKLEENLKAHLDVEEDLETRYPILAKIRRQIELTNLTVAEDYMNRLEREGDRFLTDLDITDSDISTLEDFIKEYDILLNAIRSANDSVESAYKQRYRIHSNSRENRETRNALEFLHGWQGLHSGHNAAIERAITEEILSHIGYPDGKISAHNIDQPNQKSYTVEFPETNKPRDSYPHPFAVFGTEVFSKGLEVIYLGASRQYDNIAQVLSSMTSDRGKICLMDHALTLPERRKLAKSIKINVSLKNIIVIDKVMALYLSRFDDANRGKRMLQAALPFARVQPYTKGGVVAPEMFIGRSEELDQIRDMTGPVLVYGGRQLGKSALLHQVSSIEHNPAQKNFAFFIDLKDLDSEQALKKIVYELRTAKLIGNVETWDDFAFTMRDLLNGQLRGVETPKKLLLLLDESDFFISSPNSERAINILRELLVSFSGKFKFVLAGLHKVIRFEQNSSFGNLNHISVLPFRPSDAMELLVKPMSYLGFNIADESLISAIFSRANYYPGLIQYYCKMLVDAVSDNYRNQNFDATKNPPYPLNDDYLRNMLGNTEFQEEINRKFEITLRLDDDNFYEILALAVALLYYENNRPVSVDAQEIRDICMIFSIDRITKLADAELLSLLEEMVALNLLRRVDGKFQFNRYAFWHMMGTENEVEKKLTAYAN